MAVTDACYFTAGDVEDLRAARQAKVLVATSRVVALLGRAGVRLDAVVGSGRDESEVYRPIEPPPAYVVRTAGNEGGTYEGADGRTGSWAAADLTGPVGDAYRCAAS